MNADTEFGTYRASYSLKDGVLRTERRLLIKKAKIPTSGWNDYKKLAKTISDDHDRFIQLHFGGADVTAEAVENNPEAESLIRQAGEAGMRRDVNSARDYLARAERLNPKQQNLWVAYGFLYMIENQPAKALEAFGKEIKLLPGTFPHIAR